MPGFNLMDLTTVVRSWGRGVVLYASTDAQGVNNARWDGSSPIFLNHLGDTEGDIVVNKNPQMDSLTLPELTGPAPHDVDYSGEAPVIEIPLFLADPALERITSPIGQASAGRSRRSAPLENTLVIMPEGLFLEADSDGVVQSYELAVAGGTWTLNGASLTGAQSASLDVAFWAWRVIFSRPPKRFRGGAGNDRKNIETVSAMLCHHPDMPEGHHLYTTGDPYDSGIDLEGSS